MLRSEYLKQWIDSRRDEYIKILGGKCKKCSSKESLQFDHIKPKSKSFTISSHLTYRKLIVLKELKKCQLLCKTCHKDKTWAEMGKAVHGAYTMYKYHRCRCEPCKNANKKYTNEYRWRTGRRKQRETVIEPT